EGLVYPDFARCVTDGPAPDGQHVGGMDFGLRNPFAALWGVLDRDGVLWLTGEHYGREQSLSWHAQRLPRDVTWYADPAGAREIHELRCAGFAVRKGDNDRRPGIAAVRARLEDGTLKVLADACPNLVAEAGLYRYDTDRSAGGETPVKEHDHALDALRYLVSRIDARRLARIRRAGRSEEAAEPTPVPRPWLRLDNEALWHSS